MSYNSGEESLLRWVLVLSLILSLSSCSAFSVEHDPHRVFADPDAYKSIESIVQGVQSRKIESVGQLLHPDFQEDETAQAELSRLIESLPKGDLNLQLFYAENRVGVGEHSGTPIYFAAYESLTASGFVQLNVAVAPHDNACCVGTYINAIPGLNQPSTFHDLTLSEKSWLHYLVFIAATGVFLLTVFTCLFCLFSSNTKRKWFWLPFVLVGLWGIHFNWTTGELSPSFIVAAEDSLQYMIIDLQLFGVGVSKPGHFRPWIVAIGTPIGALLYWFWPSLRTKDNNIAESDSND